MSNQIFVVGLQVLVVFVIDYFVAGLPAVVD